MLLLFRVKLKTILIAGIILAVPTSVGAQSESQIFNIDPSYDLFSRQELEAQLIRTTPNLYFYIEKNWWDSRSAPEQNAIRLAFFDLGEEFKNRIYPVLTATFGSEPKLGIDKDEKITVLIHQMRQEAGGYFSSGDVYSRFQNPKSNEREMVYLNSRHIDTPQAKSFLAHEFTHLITVNQKDLLRRVTEEVWLNELRAEYAPTLLGYDGILAGSNLETRVKSFLDNPKASLTEWLNLKADYGAVNLFAQYLADHYGVRILSDSMLSSKVGIASLEEALQRQGVQKSFAQVFSDWAVALLVNDCSFGQGYCYLKENLKNLRIVPTLYFLPKSETVLSTLHQATHWSLNWHRIVGGRDNLNLEFEGDRSAEFEVPYLLCEKAGRCQVNFINLDAQQKGGLTIADFSQRYNSLTILPFIKSKTEGFNGEEKSFTFSWKVSVGQTPQTDGELINQLLAKIAELKEQVRQLQAKLAALLGGQPPKEQISCNSLDNNLYFGMENSQEVRCLQEFLRAEGVYKEGLVTGNFLSLTKAAVIRFQEKYASEILAPLRLPNGTGYVGQGTRTKINQLLAK